MMIRQFLAQIDWSRAASRHLQSSGSLAQNRFLIVATIAIGLFWVALYLWDKHRKRLLRGGTTPKALFLERCRARYGRRFTIRLPLAPPFVMVSDPEDVKRVFTAPPEVLHPGEGFASTQWVLTGLVGGKRELFGVPWELIEDGCGERAMIAGSYLARRGVRTVKIWSRQWPNAGRSAASVLQSIHPEGRVIAADLAPDHDVTVAETSRRGHAARLAQGAAASGSDVVIVLGGDGTLNEAANGLAGTATALAPLPGGSTNVFARTIGLPNDPIEATGVLLDALARDLFEIREVDRLLEEARRSTDQEERARLYKEMQAIVHEDAPWAFIANWKQNAVTSARVEGFQLEPSFFLLLHDVTKS